MKEVIQTLNNEKLSLFGEADSLLHAQHKAEQILDGVDKQQIAEVLDIYHNTLINHLISVVSGKKAQRQLKHLLA